MLLVASLHCAGEHADQPVNSLHSVRSLQCACCITKGLPLALAKPVPVIQGSRLSPRIEPFAQWHSQHPRLGSLESRSVCACLCRSECVDDKEHLNPSTKVPKRGEQDVPPTPSEGLEQPRSGIEAKHLESKSGAKIWIDAFPGLHCGCCRCSRRWTRLHLTRRACQAAGLDLQMR